MNFSECFWNQFSGKKVVLYGADVSGLAFLYWAEKVGIEIAYFVDRNDEKQKVLIMGKKVKAPIELIYENPEDIKIVITSPRGKDMIIKTLNEMGFRSEQIVTEFVESRLGADISQVDILLGVSRGNKICYEMKQKEAENEIVIAVVGGSTTDPLFGEINSWSFYLQEMINNTGLAARVVNIAECGYRSSQELLVLLRDGLAVKPDVLISYSGFNDVSPADDIEKGKRHAYTSMNLYLAFKNLLENYRGEQPFPDVYYGELEAGFFERYITNMRLMHAVCAEFDCRFYGLLQPSLVSVPVELLKSPFAKSVAKDFLVSVYRKRWHLFYNKYLAECSTYSYLYDFTHILDGHDDVFEDICHVSEDGNRIIAENIFALLMEQKIFGHN